MSMIQKLNLFLKQQSDRMIIIDISNIRNACNHFVMTLPFSFWIPADRYFGKQ